MSSAKVPTKGSDAKSEVVSRPCPTSCGASISGRDPHPMCIACMGVQHAQASAADPHCCTHCMPMPKHILERRLRVAVSHAQDPCLSNTVSNTASPPPLPAEKSWGEIMEEVTPDLPPIFENLDGELDDEDAEGDDANSDILNDAMEDGEDEEDSSFPTPPSRPPSSIDVGNSQIDPDFYDVCKRAAAKLGIAWPASPETAGAERDLYDGKRLPPAQQPAKQLLPPVPACMREMRKDWSSPFKSKLPTKGYSKLEIEGMSELGLTEPPAVEPSLAFHLHPNRRSVSAASTITLPSKMERLTASTFQRMYKYAAQSICSLNASTLLSAYLGEILEEMGQQIDSGSPNPVLWNEICVVSDLILRSSRGAVQGCGRVMGLAVAGERALWLNLSGLSDVQKLEVMDSAYDPTKGLFGPALVKMRETSEQRKQEGEAFDLCLPRKQTPRPAVSQRGGFHGTPATRGKYNTGRPQGHTPNHTPQQQQQQQDSAKPKPWGKQSFAAIAAKKRASQPPEGKKKRAS